MSARLIFDLANVSRAKKGFGGKIIERDIISLYDDNGVQKVKYRVKKHHQKRRIDEVNSVTRKAFVEWLDGIQINKDEFQRGDIIEFGEYKLVVLKNHGAFGKVKSLDEGHVIEKLYWRGCSEIRCFKTGVEKGIL